MTDALKEEIEKILIWCSLRYHNDEGGRILKDCDIPCRISRAAYDVQSLFNMCLQGKEG